MILFLCLIEQCIINNYNLVNNLHVHYFNFSLFNFIIVTKLYIFFKQFIVFNNILFNLNLIRILCYRSILVRYDLSAFYISFLMCYIFYFYFLCAVCEQLFTILQ